MNVGEINEDDNREWVPATTEIIIRYHTFKSKESDSSEKSDSSVEMIVYRECSEDGLPLID